MWSGNRPKDDVEAKHRLCEAALECVRRNGFDKSTMSDFAKEAGVARPTLYKHFKSKNEVFFAAIDDVSLSFAQSVVEHAKKFTTAEECVIETIIFAVTELPTHRHLSLVLNHECAEVLRTRAFSDNSTAIFPAMAVAPLIDLRPDLASQGIEIGEVMSRFAMSIILFPGRYASDEQGLRALIKKRILPGLIISDESGGH